MGIENLNTLIQEVKTKAHNSLQSFLSKLLEIPFIKKIHRFTKKILFYKQIFSNILTLIWISAVVYWVYQFIILEVKPYSNLPFSPYVDSMDGRDAMTYIFFGGFISILLLIVCLYLLKWGYNLTIGYIIDCLPHG